MGRRRRTVDATATITRTTFDELGRVVSSFLGTNDADVGGTDNMVETSRNAYDGGSAGGNSHLTTRTLYVENSTTDQRVTTFDYDFRGRMLMVTNALAPHTVNEYDNLGRITASAQYSSTVSASTDPDATGTQTYRVALHKSFYDELGRVYEMRRYEIDQADGSIEQVSSVDQYIPTMIWRAYPHEVARGIIVESSGEHFDPTLVERFLELQPQFTAVRDRYAAPVRTAAA